LGAEQHPSDGISVGAMFETGTRKGTKVTVEWLGLLGIGPWQKGNPRDFEFHGKWRTTSKDITIAMVKFPIRQELGHEIIMPKILLDN
jgi:hypothetical protein